MLTHLLACRALMHTQYVCNTLSGLTYKPVAQFLFFSLSCRSYIDMLPKIHGHVPFLWIRHDYYFKGMSSLCYIHGCSASGTQVCQLYKSYMTYFPRGLSLCNKINIPGLCLQTSACFLYSILNTISKFKLISIVFLFRGIFSHFTSQVLMQKSYMYNFCALVDHSSQSSHFENST